MCVIFPLELKHVSGVEQHHDPARLLCQIVLHLTLPSWSSFSGKEDEGHDYELSAKKTELQHASLVC